MPPETHPDERDSTSRLEQALEEARGEFSAEEFERSVRLGEQAGERAAMRETWRWMLWLLMGAALLMGFVSNAWLLVPTAVLMSFYCLPFILASDETAAEDAEALCLHEASEQHRLEPKRV